MPLTVTLRKSTGSLTITGTVAGQRIRRRAASDRPELAAEEAAALEAEILRIQWHGPRRGVRSFAEAALSYLEAAPRSTNTKDYVRRILVALGDVKLGQVDQDAAIRLRRVVLRADAGAATYLRQIVTPVRAILRHAAQRGWCDMPHLAVHAPGGGRTRYLLPAEAELLIAAAAPHLQPLLIFLLGTGARMSEAIELDWRDVDLAGARAIFWRTKTDRRHVAALPPRVIAALANLPHREGAVFRSDTGRAYADHGRRYGGQIKHAWQGARRRAKLDPELTPHDLRHTFASWHWALNRDPIALRLAGGWSSIVLLERYTHLLPEGHNDEIRRFLGVMPGQEGRLGRAV
jgi:integrase